MILPIGTRIELIKDVYDSDDREILAKSGELGFVSFYDDEGYPIFGVNEIDLWLDDDEYKLVPIAEETKATEED
jgi:hypothetical protein